MVGDKCKIRLNNGSELDAEIIEIKISYEFGFEAKAKTETSGIYSIEEQEIGKNIIFR